MPIKWKQFVGICGRHHLHPSKGRGFWMAHRPWGGPFGTTLVYIKTVKGAANDFAVFRALAPMVG